MTKWLHLERLDAAHRVVRRSGARSVLDLGCGSGDLLTRLATDTGIERVVGVDHCRRTLARLRFRLAALQSGSTARIDLVHASMTESRAMFSGFDCAILVEAIEHVEPEQISALEHAVFRHMRPGTVVVTTPNAEFNLLLGVPPHRFRHPDHRFEWGRTRFRQWAHGVAARNRYIVACRDIAGRHPDLGGASQMAVFAAVLGGAPAPYSHGPGNRSDTES